MPKLILNIDVPDIETAITFCTSALELNLGRRFDSAFVELLGAEVPIYLLQKQAGTAADPGSTPLRGYGRHWTAIHADFVVPEIQAAIERAVAAGAEVESGATDTPYGKIATLADPFGHGFCLIEFNDQGYDALVDE